MKVSDEMVEAGARALAGNDWQKGVNDRPMWRRQAKEVLEAALASQPQESEAEPVAYTTSDNLRELQKKPDHAALMWGNEAMCHGLETTQGEPVDVPLFAHPPTDTPQAEGKDRLVEKLRMEVSPMGLRDETEELISEAADRIEHLEEIAVEYREFEKEVEEREYDLARKIGEQEARAQSAEARLAEVVEAKGACENFLADLLDNEPDNISLPMWERAKSLLGRE